MIWALEVGLAKFKGNGMDEGVTWGSLLPWPHGSPVIFFFLLIYKRKGEERQLIIGMIECNKNHN